MRGDRHDAELALIAFVAATEAEPQGSQLCARMMDTAAETIAALPPAAFATLADQPERGRFAALAQLRQVCAACAACPRAATFMGEPPDHPPPQCPEPPDAADRE